MSLAVKPIETVRLVDPIVNFGGPDFKREYGVITGGSQVSYKQFTANSVSSSSMLYWTPPPNPAIASDPQIFCKYTVTLEFNVTNLDLHNAHNAFNNLYDAPTAYPLSNATSSLNVTIGNASAAINLQDVLPPLTRVNNNRDIKETTFSTCPSYVDTYKYFSDCYNANNNPLGNYSNDTYQSARGAYPIISMTNPQLAANTSGVASVTFSACEPIFISPLAFGKGAHNRNGIIGVQTINWTFTFSSLAKMWNHSYPYIKMEFTKGTFSSDAQLLFKYVTPKLLQPIPSTIVYPYDIIQRYPNAVPAIGSGSSAVISSSNIQLQSIPKMIYVYAKYKNPVIPNDPSLLSLTDTYLPISNVSVNYNNMSSLLATATKYDLYHMSRRNGVNMNWDQWSGYTQEIDSFYPNSIKKIPLCGSILAIAMGIDIGLDDLHAPGEIFNSQLQINVTIENNTGADIALGDYDLFIVTVIEGIWTIENLSCIPQTGVLSKQDILDAEQKPGFDYSEVANRYGGDFMSSLKKFGNAAVNAAKTAAPYVKKGAEAVSKGIDAAETVGALAGLGYSGGANSGGRRHHRGAALVTRAEMGASLHERLR